MYKKLKNPSFFRTDGPWIWLNAAAVSLSLIMVLGLLILIFVRGLGHFWPSPVVLVTIKNDSLIVDSTLNKADKSDVVKILGELVQTETITRLSVSDSDEDEASPLLTRHLFKQGNRDTMGTDFVWIDDDAIIDWQTPPEAIVLERMVWGNFYGFPVALDFDGTRMEADFSQYLKESIQRASSLLNKINRIERREIGRISRTLEGLRHERLSVNELSETEHSFVLQQIKEREKRLIDELETLRGEINELRSRASRDTLYAKLSDGKQVRIPVDNIVRSWQPNTLSFWEKIQFYGVSFWDFIFGYPREANTEGGIFPAIFGTVIMVLIMTIIVTPLGILAAIYLREYARQGMVVRLIRISVYNLAGVPSIVFGIFGLGFFVYFLGGRLDQLFYSENLPSPTFGTPGLFWASLTLALLTLPVVIVATEEALTRIPRSIRDGCLALGATKAETVWRVVVPLAAPGMMTGMILAVARAAGEVAPLMLVGVVKLAPNLPVDSDFPYVHLERKIMHLGFHIFDVGFQSPNVEAGRPLVYATALILVIIILILNLTAISLRARLRERYRSSSD